MKKILIRVLAAIGLVPARRYTALKRRLDEASHESRGWKKRADKMGVRVSELEGEIQRRTLLLKEARGTTKKENKRENRESTAMQTRLVEAERALVVAREQLMAIEVKLDILEGAANVLDARTRTAPQRQPGQTTAV